MKRFAVVLLIAASLAVPARAATWSIGPSIGFDVLSASGELVAAFGAPAGPGVYSIATRPGLRLGITEAGQRHQLFFDTALQAVSGSGSSFHTVSGTVNYAHHFRQGSSPYLTAGIGFTNFGFDGDSESLTLYGLGFGGRKRLAHGHGAIRVEARFDRASSERLLDEPLNMVGVRVGFDLDLN